VAVIVRWSWRPNSAAPPAPAVFGYQFECRRLGANAVRYWDTRYIALILAQIDRLGIEPPDGEIAGVHNAHHEHIDLIGHHHINLRAGPRKPPTTASTARSQRTPQPRSD
jgi:hypothetical protein